MIATMAYRNCPFCKIVDGELPSSRIYEDETTIAFLDTRPQNDGHTLVIPKKHYEYIYDVPDEEVAHLHKVAKRVACAVRRGMNSEGISITQHNESAAGKTFFTFTSMSFPDMKDRDCTELKKSKKHRE